MLSPWVKGLTIRQNVSEDQRARPGQPPDFDRAKLSGLVKPAEPFNEIARPPELAP